MRVTLAPLRLTDFPLVAAINVRADQIRFSGTVREVFDTPAPDMDVHAIISDDAPVGLFRIDRNYPAMHGFALHGDLGLRTVMIDAACQGKGIGTSAMLALPTYLRDIYPKARRLWLTVNLQNSAAIASYLKGGFTDTGAIWPHGDAGPQHIMRLAL